MFGANRHRCPRQHGHRCSYCQPEHSLEYPVWVWWGIGGWRPAVIIEPVAHGQSTRYRVRLLPRSSDRPATDAYPYHSTPGLNRMRGRVEGEPPPDSGPDYTPLSRRVEMLFSKKFPVLSEHGVVAGYADSETEAGKLALARTQTTGTAHIVFRPATIYRVKPAPVTVEKLAPCGPKKKGGR